MILFFDIGATLVTGPVQGPASRLSEALGLDLKAKVLINEWLLSEDIAAPCDLASLLIDRLGLPSEAAETQSAALWRAQEQEAVPLSGTPEIVHSLQTAGYRIGAISNIWRPYYHSVLAALPSLFLSSRAFSPIVLSYKSGVRKPAAGIFLRALREANVPPAQAVMIGDSYEEDMAPAIALGMKTLWLVHRFSHEARWVKAVINGEAVPPDRTLASIANLTPEQIACVIPGVPGVSK